MTAGELVHLVAMKPQIIWDILREAAYFREYVDSQCFTENEALLTAFLADRAVLQQSVRLPDAKEGS